jgi:GT2 family glycosyltransferase
MTASPRITVVIPTHNRPARLAQLLGSLRHQTIPREDFEVIVVHDRSAGGEGAVEVVERERALGHLDVTHLSRDGSAGPADKRNEGWRAARAPLVAFTDDDCTVTTRWLERLLTSFEGLPADDFVQGMTLPTPDEAHDSGLFSHTIEITHGGPYYETCNIAYQRATLERLGGFDTTQFSKVGGEDTDLAWRARGIGAQSHFDPEALVYHAVERLGPWPKLRTTWRHGESIGALARHPQVRKAHLSHRIFWRPSHYFLLRALLALALPRWMRPLGVWLVAPYARNLTERSREAGAFPFGIPYLVVYDCAETAAVTRGAARERVLIL